MEITGVQNDIDFPQFSRLPCNVNLYLDSDFFLFATGIFMEGTKGGSAEHRSALGIKDRPVRASVGHADLS
jgi:hypothetical protein